MNHSLYVGIILIGGLIGGKIASKCKLPSVTGYILFGLFLGPSFTNIISKEVILSLRFINHLALGILSFSIGTELHHGLIKKLGKALFFVSLGNCAITFLLVFCLTFILGLDIQLSIVLGILSMSVSPSGVVTIIKEYGAKGRFTQNVLALVAMDNLICIVSFGVITAIIKGTESSDVGGILLITSVIEDIILTAILGFLAGIMISFTIKRITNNSKFLVFLLGVILLNTGFALQFELSALLLNMITGASITNLTNSKPELSSTLEKVELPIFIFFLTLAGAKLDLSILQNIGIVGLVYIVGRLFGKVGGSFISSRFTSLKCKFRRNIGIALTPQSGVAIGLSVMAEQKLPQSMGIITGVVLCGVIFFEIVGPLLLKQSLKNMGEIP